MFTWIRLQSEVGRWSQKNFPDQSPTHPVWGLLEELGELTHAHLKGEQGIRGSAEEHAEAAKDAVADSMIYFMDVCGRHGFAVQELLRTASPEEFQATFSVPPKRHPLTHALKHLAMLVDHLEMAGNAATAIEKDAYLSGAKNAALPYVSALAAYCTQRGWALQTLIDEVWPKVRQRDWTKNKVDGTAPTSPTKETVPSEPTHDSFELAKVSVDPQKLAGVIDEVGIVAANPNVKKMEVTTVQKDKKDRPSENKS